MSRAARARKETHAALVFAGLVTVVLLGVLLARPSGAPSPGRLLGTAMTQLAQTEGYTLVIEEKAPRYSLLFQGQVEGGKGLIGRLPGYDLEVFYQGDLLQVREVGETEWDEAVTQELQGLAAFLINPVVVLQSQLDNFHRAAAGEEINLSGVACQTVFLEISEEEQLIKRLFPNINMDTVQNANLGLALAEPGLTVKQLRILVEFTGTGGSLERVYYIDFD